MLHKGCPQDGTRLGTRRRESTTTSRAVQAACSGTGRPSARLILRVQSSRRTFHTSYASHTNVLGSNDALDSPTTHPPAHPPAHPPIHPPAPTPCPSIALRRAQVSARVDDSAPEHIRLRPPVSCGARLRTGALACRALSPRLPAHVPAPGSRPKASSRPKAQAPSLCKTAGTPLCQGPLSRAL